MLPLIVLKTLQDQFKCWHFTNEFKVDLHLHEVVLSYLYFKDDITEL